MDKRWLAYAIGWALGLTALAPLAEARAIPLPCTGDTLVKVVDIPATHGQSIKANADLPEKRLDLGYKFSGCFGGEWIGHLGSNSRYLPLTPDMLNGLLTLAGLTKPPPVPNRLTHGGYGYLWPAILLLALLGGLKVLIFGKATPKTTPDVATLFKPTSKPSAGVPSARTNGADAAMEAAISRRIGSPTTPGQAKRAHVAPSAVAPTAAPMGTPISSASTRPARMALATSAAPRPLPASAGFGRRVTG